MTYFYAFKAMAESSENSLDHDNNDEPISTQKHIHIYYSGMHVTMSSLAYDWVFSKRFRDHAQLQTQSSSAHTMAASSFCAILCNVL
jgi:hypothetical protein